MATGQATGERAITSSIVIRKCHALDEMRACVALQKEVWNFSDAELVPLRLFVVAEKIGGQVIGAFRGDEMVGFALAVRKEYRNAGLGRRIKLFQRDDALARAFELIEWTFDPLEIKNAYLNIVKLGAIARRYTINQYGITSSPLQGGLPTDRLVAEWWLKSKRVQALLCNGSSPPFDPIKAITVPAEIYEMKASSEGRRRAQEIQDRNREDFLRAFSEGLAVLGYERDQTGNGKFLLGRWDEKWQYAATDRK